MECGARDGQNDFEEEAKAEGYDGCIEWEDDTEALCMKYEFYKKVKALQKDRNNAEILEVFDTLGVAATV
ncbi:hypothetical protein KIN20_004748 [Parelaphostrongylus tenuis]|uniref:Uncharacterized protein n=1 Tax=Parelaphostrongylus tenuis TaxID=148309 RepID=A0AAD5MKE0_PARTN|nr:hypothetical protein KIN20_004748 [Parelaphostrongylus tenuis]